MKKLFIVGIIFATILTLLSVSKTFAEGKHSKNTQPKLSLHVDRDDHKAFFTLRKIENCTKFSYTLTYKTDSGTQGVVGSGNLNSKKYTSSPITLGTCSQGVCTYDKHPHDFDLKASLVCKNKTILLEDTHK